MDASVVYGYFPAVSEGMTSSFSTTEMTQLEFWADQDF